MLAYLDLLVTALLTIGATARITRLITFDRFPFGPVRDWALTRYGEHGWLPDLLHCPWCTGVWVAAPATVSAVLWGDQLWWQLTAAFLSLAFVAAALVTSTNRPG